MHAHCMSDFETQRLLIPGILFQPQSSDWINIVDVEPVPHQIHSFEYKVYSQSNFPTLLRLIGMNGFLNV